MAAALIGLAAGHPRVGDSGAGRDLRELLKPGGRAARRDPRDADGDGIYCESLPCPCAKGNGGGGRQPAPSPTHTTATSCVRPRGIVGIGFSATKYPDIRQHMLRALHRG